MSKPTPIVHVDGAISVSYRKLDQSSQYTN